MESLTNLIKNKVVLTLVGITFLLIILLVLIPRQKKVNDTRTSMGFSNSAATAEKSGSSPGSSASTYVGPTSSLAELTKATNEAKQSASEYDEWQAGTLKNYPWIRTLPLATEKYFVYFDTNQGRFLGELFPVVGDNIDAMKAEIIRRLKEEKQIPAESYTFVWTVSQKKSF